MRLTLYLTVVIALAASAIGPYRLSTWVAETVWVTAGLVIVALTHRRFPLTTLAGCLLAVHALVLVYGGHYSYARTPLGDAVRDALNLGRNPYDRLGHFMQGFAPAIVVREVLWRRSPLRGSRWLAPLTVCVCLAISAFWELLEWWGAEATAGGDPAFLGGQGDPWDTQWDMFLALTGAILALATLTRLHNRALVCLHNRQPAEPEPIPSA
jgi:putative membrane protein